MIVVRSFLAGILALVGYAILIVLALWALTPREDGVGVIVGPGWPILIGAVLVFAGAFCWAFSKGRR